MPVKQSYSFGFIFKTSSDEVMRVMQQYRIKSGLEMSPGAAVVVKHVSSLLDVDYSSAISSIQAILFFEKDKQLRAKGSTDANSAPLKHIVGIKHPYLGILQSGGGSLIVMTDVGAALTHFMRSPHFRQRWARSRSLRRAFFADIGLSALNLVDNMDFCHNDIRPPNIALRGESFCLLDFDFARRDVMSNKDSAFAPPLPFNLKDINETVSLVVSMMCFSVAQIILTVFMLSGPKAFDIAEVTAAVSVWTQERDPASQVDADFERWALSRGGLALEFISAFRDAIPWPSGLVVDHKKYFIDVLAELLD
jgi:serine/threonine protein kinase